MRQILLIMLGLSVSVYANFSRDNTTEIVTDNNTGLEWQDDANASSVTKTWTEAIVYCEGLDLGSYTDWRLPNFNELYYIADRSKRNPAIDATFQNVSSNNYWSSTTVVGYEDYAWDVRFSYGLGYWGNKSNSYYIRCVRAGQS